VIPFNIQAKQSGVELTLDLEITRSPSALDPLRLEALTQLCILGDEGKISQVVRNLISNALKFTPSGGSVTVTCKSPSPLPSDPLRCSVYWDDSPAGDGKDSGDKKRMKSSSLFQKSRRRSLGAGHTRLGEFVCVVQDTGHGISPQDMVHLFKEGMQFHANQLQAGGGSGLGLWISKGIVEMHGGSLTAQSEGEGRGCCFTLRLPAFHCRNSHFASVSAEMSKQLTTLHSNGVPDDLLQLQAALSGAKIRKVLVVDDVLSSRKIICRLLRLAGCEFVEAVNGKDCVEKLSDQTLFPVPPDLILMDYEMPMYAPPPFSPSSSPCTPCSSSRSMNGPTAALALREAGCHLTIIGLTGNVLQEDVDYFLAHGANAVLPKPLTVMRLLQCLGELSKAHVNVNHDFGTGDGEGARVE
jgi:CheY-like chemotaxis protein